MERVPHTYRFTHEYDASGKCPARSYWDVQTATGATVGTLCLHHRSEDAGQEIYCSDVCGWLDQAYRAGRESKTAELRSVLGIK